MSAAQIRITTHDTPSAGSPADTVVVDCTNPSLDLCGHRREIDDRASAGQSCINVRVHGPAADVAQAVARLTADLTALDHYVTHHRHIPQEG
ncbi:hypothetical protein ACFVZH_36625 [Streptomyces sp. NPDC059534]|uniref:hypothetical protein n=1 Tax=Streptomyces sp. NPDC059534 TaxID=3346859 RepID=UPI0036759309